MVTLLLIDTKIGFDFSNGKSTWYKREGELITIDRKKTFKILTL